jgi:hypothetical protein
LKAVAEARGQKSAGSIGNRISALRKKYNIPIVGTNRQNPTSPGVPSTPIKKTRVYKTRVKPAVKKETDKKETPKKTPAKVEKLEEDGDESQDYYEDANSEEVDVNDI